MTIIHNEPPRSLRAPEKNTKPNPVEEGLARLKRLGKTIGTGVLIVAGFFTLIGFAVGLGWLN